MVPRGCILKDGIEYGCYRMDSIGRNRRWLLEDGYYRTEKEMVPRGYKLKDGIGDCCYRMDCIGRNRRWLLENGY